jgi:cytoskeletal protein CcmA (bactofilin family)
MALWKESTPAPAPASAATTPLSTHRDISSQETVRLSPSPAAAEAQKRAAPPAEKRIEQKESVIASDLSIEGKIEGTGHVRIAGKFKGDVKVDGNLTIDQGAVLTGQVSASVVIVAGELHGNIGTAKRVELLESGVIAGDVKAGSLTVAAGSRMRGQVEFGWDEKGTGSHS